MAFDRITIDHETMGGLPCIRDLRIPVSTILGQLAAGCETGEILEDFPDLESDDILAALQHATDFVILEFARQHAFVLVSEDTDLANYWLGSARWRRRSCCCAPTNP